MCYKCSTEHQQAKCINQERIDILTAWAEHHKLLQEKKKKMNKVIDEEVNEGMDKATVLYNILHDSGSGPYGRAMATKVDHLRRMGVVRKPNGNWGYESEDEGLNNNDSNALDWPITLQWKDDEVRVNCAQEEFNDLVRDNLPRMLIWYS